MGRWMGSSQAAPIYRCTVNRQRPTESTKILKELRRQCKVENITNKKASQIIV